MKLELSNYELNLIIQALNDRAYLLKRINSSDFAVKYENLANKIHELKK